MKPHKDNAAKFDDLARHKRPSLALEFWYFLKYNKKWWLLPILVTLLLLCLLVLVGGSGLAPFIYTVF
ncbi:MAG: DUF5989 family protein [Planctomycetes bacterium]|jgi:hypothetical protein|nr:DUF5989 family protein [Planctomycetota bacterium]